MTSLLTHVGVFLKPGFEESYRTFIHRLKANLSDHTLGVGGFSKSNELLSKCKWYDGPLTFIINGPWEIGGWLGWGFVQEGDLHWTSEWTAISWQPVVSLLFTRLFSHIKNIDHLALIVLPAKHLKPRVPRESFCCGVHFSINVWWGKRINTAMNRPLDISYLVSGVVSMLFITVNNYNYL